MPCSAASSVSMASESAGSNGTTTTCSSSIAPLTPVEEPLVHAESVKQILQRSPKRQSSTVYEKVCAKLSRSGLKASLSSPSLKKAPLATEDDDLEDNADVKVVHLRPPRKHPAQRRCHSEVTPRKTAELLVSDFLTTPFF